MYDRNRHGEVVNGEGTFYQAACDMTERGRVVLNWTDRLGTLLNILLTYDPTRVGAPGGIVDSGPGKLWVGVAGHGCFGFGAGTGYVTSEYLAEKLGFRSSADPTVRALADLVTGVREQIAAYEMA